MATDVKPYNSEKKTRKPGYYWVMGNGITLYTGLIIARWNKAYWIYNDISWYDRDFSKIYETRIPEPKE